MILYNIFTHCHKKIPYEKFYDGLIDYCESNPGLKLSLCYNDIRSALDEQSRGIDNKKFRFAPTGDVVWTIFEYISLNVLYDLDSFFAEIKPYIDTFGTEPDIARDLTAYQRFILRSPGDAEKQTELNYDVHGFLSDVYVNNIHPLRRKEHTLVMRDSDVMYDWPSFGKYVVWYGHMGWASYKDDVTVIPKEE